GDDDVAALSRRRVRLGLMCVELFDPAPAQRFPQSRLERVGQRRRSRLACGLGGEMRKLFADEELVPGGDRRHATIQAVYGSLNSVNCMPSGVRSRALRPPQGGTTGSAIASA